jgi:hypothetical protein
MPVRILCAFCNILIQNSLPTVAVGVLQRTTMPRAGEANKEFGIYETLCCHAEIVIPAGVSFPQCLTHPKALTEWRNVTEKRHSAGANEFNSKKDGTAA